MPSQYICTSNRELSVNFYTRIIGLRWVEPPGSSQTGATASPIEILRLEDETIHPASWNEARHIHRSVSRRNRHMLAQDLYFLSRYSLDYAKARIRAAGWETIEGPVIRQGNSHNLRMLYLLDPDGNRIRLLEVTG